MSRFQMGRWKHPTVITSNSVLLQNRLSTGHTLSSCMTFALTETFASFSVLYFKLSKIYSILFMYTCYMGEKVFNSRVNSSFVLHTSINSCIAMKISHLIPCESLRPFHCSPFSQRFQVSKFLIFSNPVLL